MFSLKKMSLNGLKVLLSQPMLMEVFLNFKKYFFQFYNKYSKLIKNKIINL